MSEFPLLDERQLQGLVRFFQALLLPAHHADPTAPMPPPAVMVTVYEPAEAPTATVAWLGDIQARVTLLDGQRPTLSCTDLLWYLFTQPALIRGVEPVTPSLAFILYVHDLLWTWDFRPLGVAHADALTSMLLHMGPTPAQAKRQRAFGTLDEPEQQQIMRDVATQDLFLTPKRLRVPLRGLLHAGWHDFDTGELADPFRLLRYLDAALRVNRTTATPESALTRADQARYQTTPAPACPDDIEDVIQGLTATLPPQERKAVQHLLRAKHQGRDFKAYCAQHALPYDTTRKAAERGCTHLRRPL
jgi:hypothetical protein